MKEKYLKDYVVEYGNTPMTKENFNELDAGILNFLPLIQADKCIPLLGEDEKSTYLQVVTKHRLVYDSDKMGLLLKPHLYELLLLASQYPRYKNLMVHSLYYKVDDIEETQSIFFVVDIDKTCSLIIFAGTNDSLMGWKENFNMMYNHHVPCNENAYNYVNEVIKDLQNVIIIGHSKGGHIASYVFFTASEELKSKLYDAYISDSPGFWQDELDRIKKEHPNPPTKYHYIAPEASIVGRLFIQPLTPTIVKSTAFGLTQHDMTTWPLDGLHYTYVDKFNQKATAIVEKVNKETCGFTDQEARKFVSSLFRVLTVDDSKTLTDLSKHGFSAFREFVKLDGEDKVRIRALIKRMVTDEVLIKELFPSLASLYNVKYRLSKILDYEKKDD